MSESSASMFVLEDGSMLTRPCQPPDFRLLQVRSIHTVMLDQAVNEIGFFRNQNTGWKPTTPKWRTTVERLKERWPETG